MIEPTEITLTTEEEEVLALDLLRGWWMTSTQAFEDSVGTMTSIEYLKPHMTNSGKAAAHVFHSVTGITDPLIHLFSAGKTWEEILHGKWSVESFGDDGLLRKRFDGCITTGDCRALCTAACSIAVPSRLNEIEPTWEVRMSRSLGDGDDTCEWAFKPWDLKEGDPRIEEYIDLYRQRCPNPVQKEMSHAFNLEYMAEFWVMTTRAFIECSGRKITLDRLSYYMRHSGMSTGLRLVNQLHYDHVGLQTIGKIVELINNAHRRNWSLEQWDDRIEGTVHECPFAQSALPEMCHQYCAFFNGVCEVIDPAYEFVYDRMMTKGDPTCHWIIRKKATSDVARKDDAEVLKKLATRYVMGEISKQEYEELKAILH